MDSAAPARPRYARWRALSLVAVHLLFAAHLVHWKLAGRTLAPLELNELMYTLEAGIVTAGFLFMGLVCLSVLIFGRFFCSWGCHILALQDLCSWGMEKVGIRPRVVRSKGLVLIPLGAMLYMFVWPQLEFLFLGRERPALQVTGDESGWASFVTTEFWRNLPPPGVALFTFAVCGFAFVFLMGHRSFCKYACPYGAIFGLLDRVAPGRISKTGDCSACALCTAACTSDVNVHEELAAHGQVVDSACLRDLDCLNACPDGAIGFRFQAPPLLLGRRKDGPAPKPSMFTRGEELWMLLAFVPLVLVLRGLYGVFPFLLTLALAGMAGYLGVICLRLLRAPSVKLVRWQLKSAGRLRAAGGATLAVGLLAGLFLLHSALVRVSLWSGSRVVSALPEGQALERLAQGITALERVEAWGLLESPGVAADLGRLHRSRGDALAQAGELPAALAAFEAAAPRLPGDPALHFNLGRLLSQFGRVEEAVGHYELSLRLAPEDAETLNNLAYLRLTRGETAAAEEHLREAIRVAPDFPHPYFNLGRLQFEAGREAAGLSLFRKAAELDPLYAEWLADFERGAE